MIVAVLADNAQKSELNSRTLPGNVELVFADSVRSLSIIEAEAYFDLEFENNPERNKKLSALLPRPVLVNSVTDTCADIGQPFMRIAGWPTLLNRNLAEIAVPGGMEERARVLFNDLGWDVQIVPDEPGMITPRIIANIINEALFALNEGVSTQKEIDLAMKLGTNYPYGPFEWLELIGHKRVYSLLARLSAVEPRYAVSPLLNSWKP